MPRLMSALGARHSALGTRRSGERLKRGFTLVEMLVTLILLAIIGGAMTRVLVKQQQAFKDQSRSVKARRELRLGATVLPSEFRSISTSGGDITSMSESQLNVRAAIGTGVICSRTSNVIFIPPTNLANETLTSFASIPVNGDSVFLFDEGNDPGAVDDKWDVFAVQDIGASSTACPGAPYTDPVLDPPATKKRPAYILTNSVLFPLGIPDSVKVGAVVKFVRPVRYSIYQEGSGAWYLGMQQYKSGAWQSTDALAGPFRPFVSGDANPSGLQFRYYDTLGVRITDFSKVNDVGRVDVFLRTNAGSAALTERKGADLRDSVVMRVAIRNSK